MSTPLRERLRAALPIALRQRDEVLVRVLRTTLAALDNAEAVPVQEGSLRSLALEETPLGPGAMEVPRQVLSEDEVERLVRSEISERHRSAREYDEAGQHAAALRVRLEAAALAEVATSSVNP